MTIIQDGRIYDKSGHAYDKSGQSYDKSGMLYDNTHTRRRLISKSGQVYDARMINQGGRMTTHDGRAN